MGESQPLRETDTFWMEVLAECWRKRIEQEKRFREVRERLETQQPETEE